MRATRWVLLAWLVVATIPLPAAAQTALTPSAPGASTYFVDLKDGATVGLTTTIHFGLKGMGVAPAGVVKANSGHFHLLIDAEQPALDQPIPNDENHLHYGAGQTEATITLTPGKHTLQILLGDANHVPHSPPVMSPVIHVTASDSPAVVAPVAAATSGRKPSPPGATVYIVTPANGAYVPLSFVARFGLTGMGIAPAGFDKPNSGHHHLIVDAPLPPLDEPIPSNENYLHFGAGQTEANLTLPKGRHTLQLLLGDANHVPHQPPVYSQQIVVYVGMSPPARKPAPRPTYRHHYRYYQ